MNIRYSNTNTQVLGYEYIRYLYSASLITTNIFNICIQSAVWIWIYSMFIFGKIFHKYIFIYIYTGNIDPQVSAKIWTKTCLKFTLWDRGFIKSLHFIYLIIIFSQLFENEYIQYLYSVRYLRTNIFNIRIQPGSRTWIFTIFRFS